MNKKKHTPVLYLLPALLGDTDPLLVLPGIVTRTVRKLEHFVVEDLRSARRLLKAIDKGIDIDRLQFFLLNEHTSQEEIPALLQPLRSGKDLGLLSEAGLPCVADPGARLVSLAQQEGFTVRPLPGPSSIYLALMASGFNGQQFAFHGYLPADKNNRVRKIRELETDISRNDRTQIFIEAPYRNNQLLESLVNTCKGSTMLCVASELTSEQEVVEVKSIDEWKRNRPDLHKKPAVFLLYH